MLLFWYTSYFQLKTGVAKYCTSTGISKLKVQLTHIRWNYSTSSTTTSTALCCIRKISIMRLYQLHNFYQRVAVFVTDARPFFSARLLHFRQRFDSKIFLLSNEKLSEDKYLYYGGSALYISRWGKGCHKKEWRSHYGMFSWRLWKFIDGQSYDHERSVGCTHQWKWAWSFSLTRFVF